MKLGNESDLHYIWHLMLWLPAFLPSAFAKSFMPPFCALFFASLRKASTHIYEGQILVATVCRIVGQGAALQRPKNALYFSVGACAFLCSLFASCTKSPITELSDGDHDGEVLLDRSFSV
jgi:hypothetical protein